jgi:ribosome biogenesis GTPase A
VSKQTFFRELKKVIDMADVVLEVLDARDPQGCRSLELERRIVASGAQKRLVLVLNKIGKSRAAEWKSTSCDPLFHVRIMNEDGRVGVRTRTFPIG